MIGFKPGVWGKMSDPHDEEDNGKIGEILRKLPPGGRSITVSNGHIDSRDLFLGTREIIIDHGSETYRLRLTAQNRLLLTK